MKPSQEAKPSSSIKYGDIFALGDHRIACGDSCDAGLVSALLELLSDPAQRRTWIDKGLARAQAFEIARVADRYLELYHAALAQR